MQTWPQPTTPTPIPAPVFTNTSAAASTAAPSGRKKILVADDSMIILKTLTMKLKASGYDVLTAQDGASAVSVARRERPDLVLLDISFPPDVAHGGGVAWDGFLIMDWIHRMEEAKNIPVIIISGGEPEKFKDRSLAAGAIAFLHKPINPDELLTTIRRSLGQDPVPTPPPA